MNYPTPLRECCGVQPKWEGEGAEAFLKCPSCGRYSRKNSKVSRAARDWNWQLKRRETCSAGHPNPNWGTNSKGARVCRQCAATKRNATGLTPKGSLEVLKTYARVGWALDAAMRAAGLGLEDLRTLSGVRNVGAIRGGEANVSIETLARMADAMGMDLWVTFHPQGEKGND